MLKGKLDVNEFMHSLEQLPNASDSKKKENEKITKFKRVLEASNMDEIEDITLEDIDYMIIHLGDFLSAINFAETKLERIGSIVMGKDLPAYKLARRIL